ncbi:Myb/SANT-like DNA-binding domain protein [Perilla frutescens var. hirtella]|nr:Myb/SANT-like DNA-binding domain protein [Perilla frutescens var. hirtella]
MKSPTRTIELWPLDKNVPNLLQQTPATAEPPAPAELCVPVHLRARASPRARAPPWPRGHFCDRGILRDRATWVISGDENSSSAPPRLTCRTKTTRLGGALTKSAPCSTLEMEVLLKGALFDAEIQMTSDTKSENTGSGFSSGFGYDHITKKFTASDEVWDAYLEAHSKDANLRYGECPDYEDLEIAVGNGVAVGKNSIGLGSFNDAKT